MNSSSEVIAKFEAPLTDQKAWVARITGLNAIWTFGRDQVPPIVFPSRQFFNITEPGLYEHRNTSKGSGFVQIHSNGESELLTKAEVIALLE